MRVHCIVADHPGTSTATCVQDFCLYNINHAGSDTVTVEFLKEYSCFGEVVP